MKLSAPRLPSVAKILTLPSLLLLGASAQADLNFTFTGLSANNFAGYSIEQSVTFNFVVNGAYAVGSNTFTSSENTWIHLTPAHDTFISSVTGSGFAGTIPSSTPNGLRVINNNSGPGQDSLEIEIGSLVGSLTANGFSISGIDLTLAAGNVTDVFTGSYSSPQSVFSAINASLPPSSGQIVMTTSGGTAVFELESYSISVSESSEIPFGVDSTVGLATLGLAGAWKLRRRKALADKAAN